ncbi:hypothetical protein [Cellulosimicrobium sp. JZ28]|uniref:hypothetical protein n=1 Tax=Cellulosimicrobium sp. JZ28 TaxID=1906273 RepID=UPI00188C4CA6|nr:hypothetical protein [Cellulosimicrobium sp. JZ28]
MAQQHYYEVETDASDLLIPSDYNRWDESSASGRGEIVVGLPNGESHWIFGSRMMERGVGFHVADNGILFIRVNGNGKVLRRYGAWVWVDGTEYVKRKIQQD